MKFKDVNINRMGENMNQAELVESIIKEVKRVLVLRGVQVAPSPVSSSPAERPAPAASAFAGIEQSVGRRDLTGKQVITQKDLEAFQGQSITVTQNAVITPLAIDYAREKGITITKVEQQVKPNSVSANQQPVVIAALAVAPDFPSGSMIVKKFLASKGFQIKESSGKSYKDSITDLVNAVSSGTASFGICIEKSGMEGPIYANRNKNIRAVHCRETYDARAARVDIGANVIVIDSVSNPEAVISGFTGL